MPFFPRQVWQAVVWVRLSLEVKEMKRQWKQGLLSFGCGMMVAFFVLTASAASYAQQMQQDIAAELVRFHVVANSNASADQALKMKVRNAVLAEMEPLFSAASSKEEAFQVAKEEAPRMKAIAEEVLEENQAPYGAEVKVAPCRFPVKQYGDITLPAGVYDAVNIRLGAAEGENFWCVLYPSLCLVEEGTEETLDVKKMGHILSPEAYSMVTSDEVEIKWKVVEWWQEQWGEDNW